MWTSKTTSITVRTFSKETIDKLSSSYRTNKFIKPHNIKVSVEKINKLANINFNDIIVNKRGDIDEEKLDKYEETFEQYLQEIEDKRAAKREAKEKIKTKFIIGHIYRLAYRTNSKYYTQKTFKLIKFIYTINNTPVHILIMKSLDNENYHKFSLNKNECLKYHIKYQPGLEVYSMNLNWIDVTNKYILQE